MRGVAGPYTLVFLFFNATLLASLAMLPGLLVGYAISSSRARTAGPDFSLGKLESIELDRAILLYERVRQRLQQLQRECSELGGGFLKRYYVRTTWSEQAYDEERELEAYAVHLRSSIRRLRGMPVRRFRSW